MTEQNGRTWRLNTEPKLSHQMVLGDEIFNDTVHTIKWENMVCCKIRSTYQAKQHVVSQSEIFFVFHTHLWDLKYIPYSKRKSSHYRVNSHLFHNIKMVFLFQCMDLHIKVIQKDAINIIASQGLISHYSIVLHCRIYIKLPKDFAVFYMFWNHLNHIYICVNW